MLSRLFDRAPRPAVDVSFVRQDLGHLPPKAGAAFALWDRGVNFSPTVVKAMEAAGVLPRAMLLTGERGSPLVWRFVGAGIQAFGRPWQRDVLGSRLDRPSVLPDYFEAIGELYRSALAHAEPIHNYVVATLPTTGRLRYRQLVLPWFAKDGSRAVLAVTERCG